MEVGWGNQELFVEASHNVQKLCIYELNWLIDLFCNYLYNWGGRSPKSHIFQGGVMTSVTQHAKNQQRNQLSYFVNHPKYLHLMQCMERQVIGNKFLTMFDSIHTAICDLNSLIKSNERCLKKIHYFIINNIEPPLMPPSPPPISPMLLADLKF